VDVLFPQCNQRCSNGAACKWRRESIEEHMQKLYKRIEHQRKAELQCSDPTARVTLESILHTAVSARRDKLQARKLGQHAGESTHSWVCILHRRKEAAWSSTETVSSHHTSIQRACEGGASLLLDRYSFEPGGPKFTGVVSVRPRKRTRTDRGRTKT
jgi:hypothetical protein